MSVVDEVLLPLIARIERERGPDLPREVTRRKAPMSQWLLEPDPRPRSVESEDENVAAGD